MTLGRFTPFRFCSVAVVAAMFRGLAGDKRGTSASKPEASPGPERWELTVSAINSRSWLSWSGENWEPGVEEGCWRPVEREGRSRSSETPGFSVEAGKWGAMAWGAWLFACSCSKMRWAKRDLVPVVTRFRAEAKRINEFLGRALSWASVSDFGSIVTARLRRFPGRRGIIEEKIRN